MAEEEEQDDAPKPDPDSGAKKALEAERKARREAERKAGDLADRVKELEDRDKSDGEKLSGKLAEAEKRAEAAEAKALRYEVALNRKLSATQAKRLVGATKEELEADADELLESFKPAERDAGDEDDEDDADDPKPSPSNRPTPSLRGGGDPTTAVEPDLRKMVSEIPRS